MQKFRICLVAALLCIAQQSALADEPMSADAVIEDNTEINAVPTEINAVPVENSADKSDISYVQDNEVENWSIAKDMLSEIIIRPIAVIGSVTGLALFIAASPVSALASIPEPHDAFKTTWNDFVVTPYYFAFRRPFGDYSVELN